MKWFTTARRNGLQLLDEMVYNCWRKWFTTAGGNGLRLLEEMV